MICSKLATRGDGFQFPCGQCINCRVNHRRDWQSRLLLEAASHAHAIFVTLTFRDVGTPNILRRSDIKSFARTLRSHVPFRYFCAAEYGEDKGRAHYHLHLFSNTPISSHMLYDAWPYGNIDIGDTEPASLDYTLGYVLKGSKVKRWPIEERYPEFRSFSQGIGKLAFPHLLVDGHELPREFKVLGQLWPVGRYLRKRAKALGFPVSETRSQRVEKLEVEQMRSLLADPTLTPDQVTKHYQEFSALKKKRSDEMRKKAIRDAYRQKRGYSVRKRNETF